MLRSTLLIGLVAALSLTAATENTAKLDTDSLDETAFTSRITMDSDDGLDDLVVTGLVWSGDRLLTGHVPAVVFDSACQQSPNLFRDISPRASVQISAFRSGAATNSTVSANIATVDRASLDDMGLDTTKVREGRSLILLGQDSAPASLAAGATTKIVLTAGEATRLGRMFAHAVDGSLGGLVITDVIKSGKSRHRGEVAASTYAFDAIGAPWFNDELEEGHYIEVYLRNDGAAAVTPCIAFACT